MTNEGEPGSQHGFLTPDDAFLLHHFRIFMVEATRIYETRPGRSIESALTVDQPQDAYDFLRLEMEGLEQEQLRTINLNTSRKVMSTHMIYQGSINAVVVRIAEVFRPAIIDNASGLIVAHNHPSGVAAASPEDVRLTRDLVQAGKLLGIEVLDHLTIGKGYFLSLKDLGIGFDEGAPATMPPWEDELSKSRRKKRTKVSK